MNALKLNAKKHAYERLEMIYKRVSELIVLYNVQSMLKLGRAQGVAIAAAMQAAIPVAEYSPKKIKQSITGNGNADKEQVWKMLQRLTVLTEEPESFDASDALAVAICHHFQSSSPLLSGLKKVKGWDEFVSKNPQRVK